MTEIVYLHGFNSSPKSLKARETQDWLQQHAPNIGFHCPQLSSHPAQALQQAHDLLLTLPTDTLLIGSSLGGLYAGVLATSLARKAVLINPTIQPHIDLQHFSREQHNPYTGETYTLNEEDINALITHQVSQPVLEHYWLIQGSQDEVLDWRIAARHFQGCRQTLFNGDDHRLQRWPECLPLLESFICSRR